MKGRGAKIYVWIGMPKELERRAYRGLVSL